MRMSQNTPAPRMWRVVLADDSKDVRDLLRLRLEISGVLQVVGEAQNGREAIEIARAEQPDLLVLDLSMPEMDGLEALPLVREASPETRIVIFSGFEGSDVERQVRTLGAVAFYDKSTPLKTFTLEILNLLGASSDFSSPPAQDLPEPVEQAEMDTFDDQIERFRELFDEAAIGMATLTLGGRFVRLNSAMAAIFNAPVSEFAGKRYADLLEPFEAHAFGEAVDCVIKGTRNLAQLEHVIVRDSQRYVVLSTIASIRDAAARPLYLFLQVQDLSEQRRTMEALMASEQQFRLLVDAVVDYALFMLDPHGVITSWNPGAERIKGYAASEIIGQHFRVFYTAEAQRARHPEKELDEAIATGRYEEEGWRVRKDGSQFWANVIITPIRREGALVGFAKVTRDFTARRLAQMDQEVSARRVAESNEALIVAGHELADVLSMTAHEMKGPVALIRGYAEMLIHDQAGGDPVVNSPDAVKAISAQGERLAHLIDDLLTAARLDGSQLPISLENVDVRDVVSSVIAGLDPSDAATVQVRGHRLVARGDRLRLTQILSNYISNAQRHGRPPIVIDLTVADHAVKICVRDAGPGVSPDLRPRLFEKFSRSRGTSTAGGIGLGLYIVRGLARAQGGDAWYEDDNGSPCFAVSLPLISSAAVQAAVAPSARS